VTTLTNPDVFLDDGSPRVITGATHVHLSRWDDGSPRVSGVPRRFVVHSPGGFEWGYAGSGPADLALNILGAFIAPPLAWELHQRYKFDVISKLSRNGPHELGPVDVANWIEAQWRAHP
jgi:hypothetical protein